MTPQTPRMICLLGNQKVSQSTPVVLIIRLGNFEECGGDQEVLGWVFRYYSCGRTQRWGWHKMNYNQLLSYSRVRSNRLTSFLNIQNGRSSH